ncbi:uncharacterized protein [Procambarus clarkii]|uniref:uncharacterized protein n=1 Tax=Procambarus clarkii TaxID=6728 RepID=UPI001E6780EE|nr:uncharacterized protein LOC123754466 [Procambarus clarkii]
MNEEKGWSLRADYCTHEVDTLTAVGRAAATMTDTGSTLGSRPRCRRLPTSHTRPEASLTGLVPVRAGSSDDQSYDIVHSAPTWVYNPCSTPCLLNTKLLLGQYPILTPDITRRCRPCSCEKQASPRRRQQFPRTSCPATVRTLFNSLQPATRRTYRAKWVEYAAYVSAGRRGECPFDAAPSTLVNFLQSLLSRGLAYRSLHAYLAAIAFVCKLHGRRDPTRQFLVTQLLKGARNSAQRAPARRLPVTRSLLHRLLRALGGVCNSAYEKSCYRALFSLAFHACLRPGEAVYVEHGRHTLNLEQVSLTTAGIYSVWQ